MRGLAATRGRGRGRGRGGGRPRRPGGPADQRDARRAAALAFEAAAGGVEDMLTPVRRGAPDAGGTFGDDGTGNDTGRQEALVDGINDRRTVTEDLGAQATTPEVPIGGGSGRGRGRTAGAAMRGGGRGGGRGRGRGRGRGDPYSDIGLDYEAMGMGRINPPEAYAPSQQCTVEQMGDPSLPVTYWSFTLSMQTHDVPEYWMGWLRGWLIAYTLAGFFALERGKKKGERHVQGVVKLHWPCDIFHMNLLKVTIQALLQVTALDNRHFTIKPLEPGQTWFGMLGYCQVSGSIDNFALPRRTVWLGVACAHA